MIKVDCSDNNVGNIDFRGDKNLVLNELRYMTRYAVLILGDTALEAINDGLEEALEDLKRRKHDKDIRS